MLMVDDFGWVLESFECRLDEGTLSLSLEEASEDKGCGSGGVWVPRRRVNKDFMVLRALSCRQAFPCSDPRSESRTDVCQKSIGLSKS